MSCVRIYHVVLVNLYDDYTGWLEITHLPD